MFILSTEIKRFVKQRIIKYIQIYRGKKKKNAQNSQLFFWATGKTFSEVSWRQ